MWLLIMNQVLRDDKFVAILACINSLKNVGAWNIC